MKIPEKITKGDSISWNDVPTSDNLGAELSPSDGWTLNYALRGSSSLDLVATVDGDKWLISIDSTQSSLLSPGFLYWQAFVTKGSDRRTVGSGRIEILEDLASTTGTYDGRSQARKDLDAVQVAIRSLISGGAIQEYMIAGRSVKKMTLSDLYYAESKLKFQVAQEEKSEKIKAGLGNPNNLFVRFR